MQKWLIRFVAGFFILIALFFAVMLILSGGAKGQGHHDASIVINKAPEAIFPYFTEPEKLKSWIFGLVESKTLTEGGLRVGAKSEEIVELGDERTVMQIEVIAVEPNKLLVAKVTSEGFDGEIRYILEPSGASTTFRYVGDFQYKPLMARLLEPLITPAAHGKLEGDLAKLKSVVETGQ